MRWRTRLKLAWEVLYIDLPGDEYEIHKGWQWEGMSLRSWCIRQTPDSPEAIHKAALEDVRNRFRQIEQSRTGS